MPTNTKRLLATSQNSHLRRQRHPAHVARRPTLSKPAAPFSIRGDDFVKKITGNPNVDRPLQRIREFRKPPHPKVVVTVDMLSTVDIPALEFIVFLRPVKSRILWEQMLGRGTRLCPDINKSKFVVFDCFDGTLIQYFRNVSSFDIEPPGKTPLHASRSHREYLAERGSRLPRPHPVSASCG